MNQENSAPARPTNGQTAGMIAVALPLIVGYVALAHYLGNGFAIAGIFFLIFWAGMKEGAPGEFLPTLLGSLGGVALAWTMHSLGVQFGAPGMIAGFAILVLLIFVQIRDLLPMVINWPFMLLTTIAMIPQVAEKVLFFDMLWAVLLAAGYFGGLMFVATRFAKGRKTASAAG